MIAIASCESEFRQWGSDGKVLTGRENSADKGVFQINTYYHLEDSQKMGFDITTLEGNMAYARHLYETQGTAPWNWSKPRWSKGRCKVTHEPQMVG